MYLFFLEFPIWKYRCENHVNVYYMPIQISNMDPCSFYVPTQMDKTY